MYRLLYKDGDAPQSYTFTAGEVLIGRSPECQVVLKDFGISRQHARFAIFVPQKRGACLESGLRTRIQRFQDLTAETDLAENPQPVDR